MYETDAPLAERRAASLALDHAPLVQRKIDTARQMLAPGGTITLLTVLEQIDYFAALHQRDLSRDQIHTSLERFDLRSLSHRPVQALSRGQKQRLALCQVSVSEAVLWLLDEPLTALDARGITVVLDQFSEHVKQGGSVVLSTHVPAKIRAHVKTAQVLEHRLHT